jgi:type IV secretory pathway TrbL component
MMTHAQFNALRRVFIVIVATHVFAVRMSLANLIGVVLAFLGLGGWL